MVRMVPFDRQMRTAIRPTRITPNVTCEPPLQFGFGINDQTVVGSKATMGLLVPFPEFLREKPRTVP